MSDQVLARAAPRLSVRRARFREQVLDTLWFIPLSCALGAWVLALAAIGIDHALDVAPDDAGLTSDRSAFGTVAATVAAGMLTFIGVVFSTTLVAVQLAASQYSPRIVRVFVRSRITQVTLGVFLATFVYALAALIGTEVSSDEFVPRVTVLFLVVLILSTVLLFIAYLHAMVRLLRVQYLLRVTARASHDPVDRAFPLASVYRRSDTPQPSPAPQPVRNASAREGRHRGTPRVLQAVDLDGLASTAAAAGPQCWVELCIAVGEHAGPATVVARVHGDAAATVAPDAVLAHLLFGSERTLLQDPAFGIRQLADTASRALSPAINDPTTAVQALHRIVDLLERVADRPDPTGWFTDKSGVVRVLMVEPSFERLARLGFTEILRYGADSPQVTRALLGAYEELEAAVSPDRRPLFADLRDQCLRAIDAAMPAPFAAEARLPDASGMG